ncbi:MAG: amidohydrolase [Proteobacteria bacterium]|nr:amidohydrolase [Pseudomonadota bacterium]
MSKLQSRAGARLGLFLALALASATALCAPAVPADAVYANGTVFTGTGGARAQAFVVKAGRIAFVGSSEEARRQGGGLPVTDLQGQFVMPGLVDGHMHPLEGGQKLMKCSLNYERLTVPQMQAAIQKCLDDTRGQEPDGWLEVVSWFREAMIPRDADTTLATLDALHTKRPIIVVSSFGHSALINTRAMHLAKIDANTKDPSGGRINHDAHGQPSGILEDSAYEPVLALIPKFTPAMNHEAARKALKAMGEQGVTSFLDAAADEQTIGAFAGVSKAGGLTARGHFAVVIGADEGLDPDKAVARARGLAKQFDQGPAQVAPTVMVRNIKMFLDGVITAPAFTGAMLAPYLENKGSAEAPHWVPSSNSGPAIYFAPEVLSKLVLTAARAGLEPHMHADGDRAVRAALDAYQVLRKEFPPEKVRAAIAHDEAVDPADYGRYAQLSVIPVLSFQWEKRAPDTLDNDEDYLGPERMRITEPAGYLARAGARIAYGSDWPVDPLNEWFALKVAVTRENDPAAGEKYRGRLGDDPGLSVEQALTAITANSAYELHADREVGTLEAGKFADFIVLDRDPFAIPPAQLADVKVRRTVVGGRTVYSAAPPRPYRTK